MDKSKHQILIILSFFSIYVIWGSTYLFNKIAVTELPPLMLASIRFITAGVLIFIIAASMGKKLRITTKQLINCTIAGFLFLTFGNGGLVWALKYVDSGFAALEISAQPLIVLLMMLLLDGKKIQPMSIIGVVLGVIGIYLLVSQKQLLSQEGSGIGMLMIFACLLSWSYGSIFVGKADLPSNYFINTGYQMFMGGMLLLLFSLIRGEVWTIPTQWSSKVQVSMVLLIVFGGIVAYTSFNYLLRAVSPEKVATSTYVNPVIAILLGWYFLNEKITGQSILAAAILLTGVYFINTKRKLAIYSRFSK
ncbi:MAG: EamA family transporter [Flavobacteriales bacterium CG03_land_8_20_14_0_80_35_15]|nr:EamA family transporter [Zetaproteobacteria bacterium]OIO09406.1 MAG: EamA family transporter [Flavobacteriaceae bacterium CG1_02_35_72]PIV18083.1 MAG: EamA family transporter [Flavobacteriales bacterium CG03_land_8_20_14_0_80_35_15]PIX06396.1 MAG: EamA family transporter [Flavobacteriales bacterium CG_4_8_14_3_um_filter_35_10]PJA05377.1 MAG: EamA family transporter [Flavobacteriales bacterium CG_4_10_14_0_2_um_filter_35_18]